MTVEKLIRALREFPADKEVVVGHPRHDHCGLVDARTPNLGEAFQRQTPTGWIVKDELPDEPDEDDVYLPVLVIE